MLIPTLKKTKELLAEYGKLYRNPVLEPFTMSDLYDLYPDFDSKDRYIWPKDWPHYDSAGVYVILDEKQQVAYVGKASMGSWIAARLGTYFGKDDNGRCRLKHNTWKLEPKYVAVIPTPNRFEAPALEEYLITELQPPDNKVGKNSK